MKRCTKCGEEKPLDAFHARRVGAGGRNSQCKACVADYGREWRAKNPSRVAATKKRNAAAQKRGVDNWRKRNPEKVRAMRKARQERDRTDPEARRRINERARQWRQKNPEKFRAYALVQNARRREARRAMRHDIDVRAYAIVLMKDPCSYCGASMENVDHIVPFARGGATTWDNLTAACERCNKSKNHRPLLHFLAT